MRAAAAFGALCILLSSWLLWIEAPISGGAHTALSFGWMALVIGGSGGVALFRRSARLLTVCGVVGFSLCGFSVLHLSFRDPAFWSLVDENAQYAQILKFSRYYLPENLGVEPIFRANLATETVLERLATAAYFMSFGWWICLVGSLLLMNSGIAIGRRETLRWTATVAIVIFSGQGLLLGRGVVGQYLLDSGDRYLAHGRYAEATAQYEAAQRLDPQFTRSERMHRQLGEAYYHLGLASHPNTHFYLGDRSVEQNDFKTAIAEYQLAAREAGGALASIIRRHMAWTYVNRGLTLYAKAESGGASYWWEKALTCDGSQIQAVYALVRAYFDQGRYEQSIALGKLLVSRSQNRQLNADVQSNIGDSYWKLHDFINARQAYEASMRSDTYANFRIFRSLGGT